MGRRARAGLGQYWDLFNELGIDSTSFPLLTLQDLYSLGVDNVTDRKRMFQLVLVQGRLYRGRVPTFSGLPRGVFIPVQPHCGRTDKYR